MAYVPLGRKKNEANTTFRKFQSTKQPSNRHNKERTKEKVTSSIHLKHKKKKRNRKTTKQNIT